MPRTRNPSSTTHRATPDPLAARVGARVRALRLESGFSFDAFVEETGLGRGYVSELERGLVIPSLHTLDKLARALSVTMADLVAGHSPRELLVLRAREAPPSVVRAALELLDRGALSPPAARSARRSPAPPPSRSAGSRGARSPSPRAPRRP